MLGFLKALNFYYQFSLAVIPNNTFVYYPSALYLENPVQLKSLNEIKITTPKEMFFIGGSFEAYFMTQKRETTFKAFQCSFNFNTGFRIKNLEIGYNHFCTHPLAMVINDKALPGSIYGSYDEIYLQFGNF